MSDKNREVYSMLEKIEKIEELLNRLLSRLFSFIANFLRKTLHFIIPHFVFNFFKILKQTIRSSLSSTKNWLIHKLMLIFHNLVTFKNKIFNAVDTIHRYPLKQKIISAVFDFKNFLLTTPPKQYLPKAKDYCLNSCGSFIKFFTPLQGRQAKLLLYTSPLFVLGSMGIYWGVNEILQKEFPSRAPASYEQIDERPLYHLYKKKILKIENIKLPVYQENVAKMRSITIDFALKLTTRFSSYYISEYDYKLKDYFFTEVEPVISDFPIETEGKEILKEKIRDEVNQFLKDHNVEGEVEDVYILYIVGS